MKTQTIETFQVIGIAVRTTNENNQAAQDVPILWNSDLPRKYTADFEIYGEKAQNPENAEVDILVAV